VGGSQAQDVVEDSGTKGQGLEVSTNEAQIWKPHSGLPAHRGARIEGCQRDTTLEEHGGEMPRSRTQLQYPRPGSDWVQQKILPEVEP